MDTKTKIQIIISLALVFLIGLLTYWIQLPADDLKAQVIQESPTVLVRIQDFEFLPDVVKIEKGTIVSWLNDETDANAGVQHTVVSYDPGDSTKTGDIFQSGLLSQGDTFSQSFTEEGVYYYNCTLHPFMMGKVCVGAASETEDADCAIETTETTGTFEGEEETAEGEEALPAAPSAETLEEDEVTVAGDKDVKEGLPALEKPSLLTLNLKEAADENYQPFAVNAQTSGVSASETTAYTKTANSGPEDLIYILPAIMSLYIARKWLSQRA